MQAPDTAAALLAGAQPLTRETVAAARTQARPAPLSPPQLLDRSQSLCMRLDRLLQQLARMDAAQLPAEPLAALRNRLAVLAQRLEG